jgi:membrane AbrB-like protein
MITPFSKPDRLSVVGQWALLIIGGLFLGLSMEWAHVPAALLLGPLVWSAVLGMRGMTIRVAKPAHRFGQAVAGALIALHLDPDIVARTVEIWPIVLVFVGITLVLACIVGLVATWLTGLDTEVSVWGFLPGMAGTMIALAHERGLDSRMVAFIQILRMLMVIGAMICVGAVLAAPPTVLVSVASQSTILPVLTTLLLAGIGCAISRWLPLIPAGASLVPIFIGGVLNVYGIAFAVPHWLTTVAYLCLGAQTGLRFTPDIIRTGARALPMLVISVLLLLFLCGISGAILSELAGTDLMTAVLATVPGSIDSIALIAVSTHADMSFVMTLQTTRLFAVVLFGPPVARLLLRIVSSRSRRKIEAAE